MRTETTQTDHILQAVFSVCPSPDVAAAATAACAEQAGSNYSGEFHDYFDGERRPQFSQAIKAADGCVALVDCDTDPELAVLTMKRLRSMGLRNLSIVAFATQMQDGYLLRAMRAGCNEFLTKPADPTVLRDALLCFQNTQVPDVPSLTATGRIISFYGSKGGVGTTTLAVHLANDLARRHRKRTLLVDHHHELGHVGLFLGIKDSQYHFDELIRNVSRLDADLLAGFVAHHTSGMDVLASPDGCSIAHKSTPAEVQLVLNFLRTQYDYVIIDSSMGYKELVPPILQASDEVFLVSTADVAALRDLARRVEHISLTEAATSKLRIIINRSTSDDAVTAEQIEAAVHFPVWLAIPNHYSGLLRSVNAGEPISPQNRSAFAQQIGKWSQKIVSATSARAEKPSSATKRFMFWRPKSKAA